MCCIKRGAKRLWSGSKFRWRKKKLQQKKPTRMRACLKWQYSRKVHEIIAALDERRKFRECTASRRWGVIFASPWVCVWAGEYACHVLKWHIFPFLLSFFVFCSPFPHRLSLLTTSPPLPPSPFVSSFLFSFSTFSLLSTSSLASRPHRHFLFVCLLFVCYCHCCLHRPHHLSFLFMWVSL